MWDKFIRCSNSLSLNTPVTKIGSSWSVEQNSPPLKASSSLSNVLHMTAGCGREEPRSWENSYFAPWGIFYLSWLHIGTSTPLFKLWPCGPSWKFWEAEVTNQGPKSAKEAAEVVISWHQGQSHQASKRNFTISGKITHINKFSDQYLS